MKYEKPNIQILIMNDKDIVCASNVEWEEGKFPVGDIEKFPTID